MKFSFWKKEINFWTELNQLIFRTSFILFVIIFIVEYIFPGFVTNWFNPVWFLIIAIISGILLVVKDYD